VEIRAGFLPTAPALPASGTICWFRISSAMPAGLLVQVSNAASVVLRLVACVDSLIGSGERLTGHAQALSTLRGHFPAPARYSPIMNLTISLAPLLSLVAGILILLIPGMLRIIVAVYLIAMGVIGLTGMNF